MKRTALAGLVALALTTGAARADGQSSRPDMRAVHAHCMNALPIRESNGDLTDSHPFTDYLHDWVCSPRPE